MAKPSIKCKQCNGEMRKATHTKQSRALQVIGLLLFLLGLPLLFLFPVGSFFGVMFMALGLTLGVKRTKVWKCKQCGWFFERAK